MHGSSPTSNFGGTDPQFSLNLRPWWVGMCEYAWRCVCRYETIAGQCGFLIGLMSIRGPSPEENVGEGIPEVLVEDGVDDGIESRVAVAEPEDDREDAV